MTEQRTLQYQNITPYKYEVSQLVVIKIKIFPLKDLFIYDKHGNVLVCLTTLGFLLIYPGYKWDGASGPTIDTATIMLAALIHDVLYQLMRLQLLSPIIFRAVADAELERIALEENASRPRMYLWEKLVNFFAGRSVKSQGIEWNQKYITIVKGKYV